MVTTRDLDAVLALFTEEDRQTVTDAATAAAAAVDADQWTSEVTRTIRHGKVEAADTLGGDLFVFILPDSTAS